MTSFPARSFRAPRAVGFCIAAACAWNTAVTGVSGAGPSALDDKARLVWREFDPAAFAAAKDAGKLVLVTIQAPWGHWDHLMAEATLAAPQIESVLAESFIPIRVDALIRPDIAARYTVGGWPTTAILIPSGQPLYYLDAATLKMTQAGGNYFDATDLAPYLRGLAANYQTNKEEAQKAADSLQEAALKRKEVADAPVTKELIEVAVNKLLDAYAKWEPDFSRKESRYPDGDSAELAFEYFARKGNRQVLDAMLKTLTEMARGGIRDQIGGGFHRAAQDDAWCVPNFEKTLSVNAEMLLVYAQVLRVTGNGRYLPVAEGIADYALGTLRDPAGWFYAYQAADSRLGEDGDYYTWTLEEASSALSEEERKIILPLYDIHEWGELLNSAPRRNVLFLREGPHWLAQRLGMEESKVAAIFEAGRGKLLQARSRREAPAVGKVLVTDANAEMAAALVAAGDLLKRPELRDAGLKAIDVVWDKTWDSGRGRMDHAWSPEAGRLGLTDLFTDQVWMTRALLAAFESSGDQRHLDRARRLAETTMADFADSINGGYMDRTSWPDGPGLLSWPARSLRDNSYFAEALLRLRHLTGEQKYATAARKALESWADEFSARKEMASPFGLAADRLLNPPLMILVVGSPADPGYAALQEKARSLYHPWKLVRYLGADTAAPVLRASQVTPPEGAACVFCLDSRCSAPYTKDANLMTKLEEFLQPDRAGK